MSRVIVVGLVRNKKDELLLCLMRSDRGVFPGQWGLPGGGIEPGENMEAALRREMREELGIEIKYIEPFLFKDGEYMKTYPGGEKQPVYMIFLLFNCSVVGEDIKLNQEFDAYRWVTPDTLVGLDLNVETIDTLKQIEFL